MCVNLASLKNNYGASNTIYGASYGAAKKYMSLLKGLVPKK